MYIKQSDSFHISIWNSLPWKISSFLAFNRKTAIWNIFCCCVSCKNCIVTRLYASFSRLQVTRWDAFFILPFKSLMIYLRFWDVMVCLHVTNLCTTVNKQLGVIKRFRKLITGQTRLKLHNAFIQPVFRYCSVTVVRATETN